MFLVGIFIHPLLFLPPVIVLQKYLHRIPVGYAVCFAAFISSCIIISLGSLQGDQFSVELNGMQYFWEGLKTVIKDLITASGTSGLIIMLDSMITGTGKEDP